MEGDLHIAGHFPLKKPHTQNSSSVTLKNKSCPSIFRTQRWTLLYFHASSVFCPLVKALSYEVFHVVEPVLQVEAAARKQAQIDFEAERRAMQEKMEAEVQELQTHLK